MSRKKFESGLTFHPVIPRMMEIAGLRYKRQLAKLLEISPQSINAYMPEGKAKAIGPIPSDWVIKFMIKTHSSLNDILESGGEGVSKSMGSIPSGDIPSGDCSQKGPNGIERWAVNIRVPWLRKECGMKGDQVTGVLMEVDAQWIDEYFSASKKDLSVWVMDSDNMEPTIHRNSMIIIDRRFDHIKGAGLYAFVANNNLIIRRVSIKFDGSADIISDSPQYPDHRRTIRDLEDKNGNGLGTTKVVGRIVFIGKTV